MCADYAPATAHRVFIGNVKKQGLHINLKVRRPTPLDHIFNAVVREAATLQLLTNPSLRLCRGVARVWVSETGSRTPRSSTSTTVRWVSVRKCTNTDSTTTIHMSALMLYVLLTRNTHPVSAMRARGLTYFHSVALHAAVNNTYGVKAVDDDTYLKMEQAVPRCVSLIQKCQKNDAVRHYCLQPSCVLAPRVVPLSM